MVLQRAHKGMLMLTEATTIAPQGYGYPNTPGIHTRQQTDAWKPVVKAVHDKGAIFLCQLWHVGRCHPGRRAPVPTCIVVGSPVGHAGSLRSLLV